METGEIVEQRKVENNIKKLFGANFEINKVEENDSIPVGGKSIFSDKTDYVVIADFNNFENFFSEVNKTFSLNKLPELRRILDSKGIDMDEKLFATLYAFSKELEIKYLYNLDTEGEKRIELYRENKKTKLSDIFNSNHEKCAEIALLTQGYLQQKGFSSTYFSGHVISNKEIEDDDGTGLDSEVHSFIIIRQENKTFIYDPTNPTPTPKGIYFPSIYSTEKNFDEEMAKGQKKFVTAKNIIDQKLAFFGVSDFTLVSPDKHVI